MPVLGVGVKLTLPLDEYPPVRPIVEAVIVMLPVASTAVELLESTKKPHPVWMVTLPVTDSAPEADGSIT